MANTADLTVRVTASVNQAVTALKQVQTEIQGLSSSTASMSSAQQQMMARLDTAYYGGVTGARALGTETEKATQMGASGAQKLANELNNSWQAGLVLAGVGATISGGLVEAVKSGADFQAQMSGVKSVLSPTEITQFGGALQSLALELGRDTVFTPTQAGAGTEELAKAGVSAQNIMGGAARATLEFSSATGAAVPDAATLAATALNAFNLSGTQAEHVADVLAGTANSTAAQVSDLSVGFQQGGATAHAMGLSFEDTAAAIGVMANAGIQGSMSGSALKDMLLRLQPSTKAAKETMEQLGIVTADGTNQFIDASGRVKDLASVADILQTSLSGLSDAQKTQALQDMFGIRGIQAGLVLSNVGGAGVRQVETGSGAISVASQAKQRLDNLNGSVHQLVGSIETAAAGIEQILEPPLRAIVDTATRVVNAFTQLPSGVQMAVVAVIALAGAAATLVGGFILIAPGILALTVALPALGAAATGVGAAMLAAAPIVLGIIAALAGVAYVVANWQQVRVIVAGAINAVADAMRVVIPILALGAAVILLPAAPVILLARTFVQNFGTIRDTVVTDVTAVIAWLGNLLKAIGGVLGPIATQIGNAVGGVAAQFARTFNAAVDQAGQALSGLPTAAADSLHGVAATVATSDPFAGLMGQVQQAKDAVNGALNGALGANGAQVTSLAGDTNYWGNQVDDAKTKVDGLKNSLTDANDALTATKDAVSQAQTALSNFTSAPLTGENAVDSAAASVDSRIASIQLKRLNAAAARQNARGPARTDSQELARLNLQKKQLGLQQQIFGDEHTQLNILTRPPEVGFDQAKNGILGTEARLKALQASETAQKLAVDSLTRQVHLAEQQEKLVEKLSTTLGAVDNAMMKDSNITGPKAVNPYRERADAGTPTREPDGAYSEVHYPSIAASSAGNAPTTITVTVGTINAPTPQAGQQAANQVGDAVLNRLLKAGQTSGNARAKYLPGAS